METDSSFDPYPEDKKGFAVPASPSHSLRMLNNYMRTDLLMHIHMHIHKRMNADKKQRLTPLHYIAESLDHLIQCYDKINLFECFQKSSYHFDPGFDFQPEQDFRHDIKLMKHHRKCHRRTIKEIESFYE